MYSPLGSTAETIVEEIEVPCKSASQALGVSAIRCMTGIACSIATSPTSPSDEHEDKFESNKVVRFEAESYCTDDGNFDDVENKVQNLFDNMPDYTNVSVSDQSPCKYTPLQI